MKDLLSLYLTICFVEKYHWCELRILWLYYVTVNVYCCLVYSFSLLYLFLQTIDTFHCTSVALPFSANTESKADYLSPHYWSSDRHPGGFTHQLPNQNLTVQTISTTKWSFEPHRVFPSDIMDPDEEVLTMNAILVLLLTYSSMKYSIPEADLLLSVMSLTPGRHLSSELLPHHSSLTPLHLVVTWSVLMAHRSCPQVISLHSMLNSINHSSPHLEWLVSLLLHTIESYS